MSELNQPIKSRFSLSTLLLALAIGGSIEFICKNTIERRPSSTDEAVELTISSINIPTGSLFKGGDNLYLRATINQQSQYEWGKGEGWSLNPGEKRPLDIHLKVQNSWIQNDQFEFKLEVVKKGGLVENVMVRCAQISKQMSLYNRNYQCNVPGDSTPLLTYRVGRKETELTTPSIKAASNK